MTQYVGPFDQTPFPQQLTARAVTPEQAPRLEGYSLLYDLAQKKSFIEAVWLSIKGELPTPDQLWLFEQALYWLSPVHIGEPATHASILSRITESWTSSTPMLSAIGLAERSRSLQLELQDWIIFLNSEDQKGLPSCALLSKDTAELALARRHLFSSMKTRIGNIQEIEATIPLRREAVALFILKYLDLLQPLMIDFLSVWAGMPLVMAEVKYASFYDVKSYPARLPEIQYVEKTNSV